MTRPLWHLLRPFFPHVDWRWRNPNLTYAKPNPWTYRPIKPTERTQRP